MRKVFIFNKGYDVRATVEVEYTTEGEEKAAQHLWNSVCT